MAFAPGIVVPLEITERRIGQITIIGDKYIKKLGGRTHTYVTYRCDCGVEKECRLSTIKAGRCISCGCHKAVRGKKMWSTHGLSQHRLFGIWSSMKGRCENKEDKNYGGRGIKVCDEWRNDFMSFYNWSLSNGYEKTLTIDRKNSNRNYEPSNCRWSTILIQLRNKRNIRLNMLRAKHIRLFYKNNKPISKIALMYGVNNSTIRSVIYNRTWV